MATITRKVHNLQTIPVSEASIIGDPATNTELARKIIRALLDNPQPPKDEFGIAPFRELWVLIHPEGSEAPTIADELTDDHYFQSWINAFSTIHPRDDFLAGYQKELQDHLAYLYKSDEYIDQKDHILYRIVAS